ncbi:MAG: diguanylate cyclase [Pirellulales bacterium]
MVDGILRKNRGCDLSTRLSGQRYLVLLADTGPRGANSAAERIRQTIECSYFDHPLGRIQLQASVGVTDVRKNDSVETLLDRLARCMSTAKKAGRNCTSLDEGTGPVCLMAPKLEIRPQSAVVRTEEQDAERAATT